jgi:ribosome-binding protein aMBF1 (putative translation factor)
MGLVVITSDDINDEEDDDGEYYIVCHVCGDEIDGVGLKVKVNDNVVYVHKECMFKLGVRK